MAGNIVETGKGLFTGGSFGLSNFWTILGYGLIVGVVVGVAVFFIQRYVNNKKYNKIITFFKRNSQTGLLVADKTIKAMTVRLDSFGNLGYRFKSAYETKTLIPKLNYEAKPNNHYVEYCRDGKIVEIAGFKDYDDERKAVGATFMDENTELGRSSMHQMNKDRYEKTNFWKEHASLLVNIGAIVVIMVFLWLIADKLIGVVGSLGSVVNQMGEIQEAQANILDSLSNLIQSTNLGI